MTDPAQPEPDELAEAERILRSHAALDTAPKLADAAFAVLAELDRVRGQLRLANIDQATTEAELNEATDQLAAAQPQLAAALRAARAWRDALPSTRRVLRDTSRELHEALDALAAVVRGEGEET